jgi:hypothetical protein
MITNVYCIIFSNQKAIFYKAILYSRENIEMRVGMATGKGGDRFCPPQNP